MFTLLGSDGKEYGPIPAEQLRQWIREGRAGGSTQVRREGDANWAELHSLAEFADIFQTPPALSRAAMPGAMPVARTFGVLCLVFGTVSLLQHLLFWVGYIQVLQHASNLSIFNATFVFFQVVAIIGLLIHFIGGAGLLGGREWARRLVVYYSVFATLLGLYGFGQQIYMLVSSEAAVHALRSFQFLFSLGFSGAMLAFHIAAILFLSRRSVRETLR